MNKHPLYNNTGLQKNNKSHVLYALANKQIELKQLEDEYQSKITKIKSDIEAMNQVICLFDEDCTNTIQKLDKKSSKLSTNDTISTFKERKKRNRYFARGECRKLVLIALRTASIPLKTNEIALKLQNIKKLPLDDDFISTNIKKRVLESCRVLEKSNIISSYGKDGLNILWKIRDLSD